MVRQSLADATGADEATPAAHDAPANTADVEQGKLSAMVSGRLEPGIGMTTGDCASCQARATRWGDTPRSAATSANAAWRCPSSTEPRIPPSGLQARKARSSSSQRRSSRIELRNAGENWFCTLTSGISARATSICASSALEMPQSRILPSRCRSAT